MDDFTRERVACVVDHSLSGVCTARELDRIGERRDHPFMVVSDDGAKLKSKVILQCPEVRRVQRHNIQPGNPMQNGLVESFKGRLQGRMLERTSLPQFRPCPRNKRNMAARPKPLETSHEP